jgi:NAD-dependent deacetylase
VLKPDVVFFGENIPTRALTESYRLARSCRVMLVVGTSAEVAPASQMPWMARQAGAQVVEVNLSPSAITRNVTHLFLEGPAGTVLRELADAVVARLDSGKGA